MLVAGFPCFESSVQPRNSFLVSTMTRIFLLRHAESANPHVFNGMESDIDLSERGFQQAEAVAKVMARNPADLVISSGMKRAVQTAEPIARECRVDLIQEVDLHERRIGNLSGQPFNTAEGIWPKTVQRWVKGETNFAPPGMESFFMISGIEFFPSGSG